MDCTGEGKTGDDDTNHLPLKAGSLGELDNQFEQLLAQRATAPHSLPVITIRGRTVAQIKLSHFSKKLIFDCPVRSQNLPERHWGTSACHAQFRVDDNSESVVSRFVALSVPLLKHDRAHPQLRRWPADEARIAVKQ